jgi:predicted ArsR family transcriptional regulator
MDDHDLERQLADIAGLGDPLRRALYRYVAGRGVAVGRDDAASALGIGRPLAAYHLDRLVADGLLEASYQRLTGRRGPGAGRPAKLYLRSGRQIELSLPARDYAALAELLAEAVEADRSGSARAGLHRAAAGLGAALGAEVAGRAGPGAGPERALAALRDVLASRGYEPYDDARGTIRLRNCPFDQIAARHRELVCGANLALMERLADQLGPCRPVRAVLDPRPGRCCIALLGQPAAAGGARHADRNGLDSAGGAKTGGPAG